MHASSPMRMLFVDQTAQLGGAELCLKDIVLSRPAGDRVLLLQHGPLEEQLRSAGVDVQIEPLGQRSQGLRKESGLFDKALGAYDVARLSRRVSRLAADMDVIYANTPKALVVSALAGAWARKPVIYHLHDILSPEHFSRSNLWLLVTLTNRLVRRVIANSKATAEAFRAAGGTTKTSVCYNGFNSALFDEYFGERSLHANNVRRDLGIDTGARLLGVFGRLAPWKGQHIAIEALKQLPDTHLMLIGDSLFGEDEYKEQLRRLAQQAEIAGRVHFLGFRSDVPALMQACDIIVHCSTAPEPFGRVIVEGMLSRRPVIASKGGGAEEIVDDGLTGLLAEPASALDLARCVRTFIGDDERRDRVVANAHQNAVARFGLKSVTADIDAIANAVASSIDHPVTAS